MAEQSKSRPKLGDVLPQTIGDWQRAYARVAVERDQLRTTLETAETWQDAWAAEKMFKAAHDTEVRRVLEAAGVDPNVIYDAFHNGSIKGGAAAREALNGVSK